MKRLGRAKTFYLFLGVSVLLSIMPVSAAVQPLWPYWVALVLIYWVLERRTPITLGAAFLLGLTLDILSAALMGQHAVGLVVIVYLVTRFRARIRFFPPWQQVASVFSLLMIERITLLWIVMLKGEPRPTLSYWLPPLVGTLLWPLMFLLLDRARMGSRSSRS